jgi:protein involved in polysaccharide export with SLBB domain
MKIRVLIVMWMLGCLSFSVKAQLPANLSTVKSSQLSNDQLLSLIKQGEASGQSQEDILRELKARGLPDAEISELTTRVTQLTRQQSGADAGSSLNAASAARRTNPTTQSPAAQSPTTSLVFGAELFSEASSLFVPNLSIATPPNYKVGPGDELLLEVYGSNVFTQKMVVSREGFINVKYAGLINANGVTMQDLQEIVRLKLIKYIPALASGGARSQLNLGSIRSITVSVTGAVKKPGTLTLPSLATLFNALYATGGPLENGSLRKIELIRGNKKLVEADLYDFLLKGDQSANIFLQDNDLIRVPFAERQVRLTGQLNRTGIFEVTEHEHLADLLFFAGGFKSDAFRGRINGSRNGNFQKEVIDIESQRFDAFTLNHGDSLHVGTLIEKYSNRVTIQGAVYKPGVYTWSQGQKLSDLIGKAAGLRGDAFLASATVLRTYDNLKKETFSVNLREGSKDATGFELLNEDVVTIFSSDELANKFTVTINGPVKKPGNFLYSDSLTLQQLILMAGGFTDFAMPTGIEIGRKQSVGQGGTAAAIDKVNVISLTLDADLTIASDFLLQPSDFISIKTDPLKRSQSLVQITGEVLYPGTYVLGNRKDRLSTVIKRAGGLLSYADINGAKLIRKKLLLDNASVKNVIVNMEESRKLSSGDSSLNKEVQEAFSNSEIALNLQKVLESPASVDDIMLEDGDEIFIPQVKNVVTVAGAVLKPVSVQFNSSKNFRYYLSSAGGYASRAKKNKVYVVLSNGQSRKARQVLGLFRNYPDVASGATIFVPEKPIKENKFDVAKTGVLISALTTLLTAFAILRN